MGRQTVRTMLVMILLIAGAYFAAFYTPMLSSNSSYSFSSRPVDFAWRMRKDQEQIGQSKVESMAQGLIDTRLYVILNSSGRQTILSGSVSEKDHGLRHLSGQGGQASG